MAFNVLLLNLIIAILANTYNLFDARSNGLFLSKILISRDEMIYDDNYGAFLVQMPPLNVIQLPFFLPALFLRRGSTLLYNLNRYCMRLQYCMFMLLFFSIYLAVSMVLFPLALLIGIADKLKTIGAQKSENERLLNNVLFLPFGAAILAFDFLADIWYFWMNSFRHSTTLKQIIIPKEKSAISHHSIRDIMSLCRKYALNKIKSTHTKQYVNTFAKKLKVNQNLQFLLFGQLIPIGGWKDNEKPGYSYTYKTMKTQELREVRQDEIQSLDDTA